MREFYVESLRTNKTARVKKATIYSELGAMRWYIERPAYLEKAGDTPSTLHKRRPQNNPDQSKGMQMASQTLPQNNLNKAKKGAEDKNKRQKRWRLGQGQRQREKLRQSKKVEAFEDTTKQPEESPETP